MHKIFDTDVAARQWVDIEAEGFGSPVCGMIYRDGSVSPGMPLGGIGTGFIPVGSEGTLDYFGNTIFNTFMHRAHALHRHEVPAMPLPFLGLAVGGKTHVLTLQKIPGVATAKQIHYWGHYPVVDLEYEIDAPISVGLRAWTPFVLGDSQMSNTPGAIFEINLRNTSEEEQTGTLAFSFYGPRRSTILGAERELVQSHNVSGIKVKRSQAKWYENQSHRHLKNPRKLDEKYWDYTLCVIGQDDIRTGGDLGLSASAWNSIGDYVATEGHSPELQQISQSSSLMVDFTIAPGEEKTVRFVLSW